MTEGLRRVRRVPEREWLAPIIKGLEALQLGEKLIIERHNLDGIPPARPSPARRARAAALP
jgi:hypothetical protein